MSHCIIVNGMLQKLKDTWESMIIHPTTGEPKRLAIGSDGMTQEKFESSLDFQLKEICRKISAGKSDPDKGFRFGPLLYYERKKSSGGVRHIHIPRIKDQLVLKWLHNEVVQKAMLKGISLTTKSPHLTTINFREELKKFQNPVVVRTDVKSFFDSIPRQRVIDLAIGFDLEEEAKQLLKRWSAQIMARPMKFAGKSKDKPVEGLPQGLSISAALAELWGTELERIIEPDIRIFRYVDDIAFICETEEEGLAKLEKLKIYVKELGLCLSEEKTVVVNLDHGVEWLGLRHFKEEVHATEEKLEKWMLRFQQLRIRVMKEFRENKYTDRKQVIDVFLTKVKNELSGKASARPKWYSLVKDLGQWRAMDVQLHTQIKLLHLQLGLPMRTNIKLPSVHKAMTARAQHQNISSPQITD